MPEISRFFGISIILRANDHSPPHFHVRYCGETAAVAIRGSRLLEGRMGPRVRRLVLEWAAMHEAELLTDWDLVRSGAVPLPIPPLE